VECKAILFLEKKKIVTVIVEDTGQEEEMLLKFIAGWVWICKRGVLSERAY